MSDETQAPEAGAESTPTPETQGPDLSNINEVLDGRLGGLEQTMQQLLDQRQGPETPEDPYQDVYGYADALGLNVPQAQEQEDDTATLQALANLGDQRAQRIIEERVSPQMQALERQVQEMKARDDMRELQQQYPKLSDPQTEQAVAEKLGAVMQNFPPGTPATKELVALAYRAWEADQMATDEGSIGQQHQQLENPAGAGPEGSQQTWNERQLGQAAPSKGASFWGF
jgi:preprotein translocase subunit SecD